MKKFTLQMSTINKNMQLFKIHFRYIYFESLKCFFYKIFTFGNYNFI